MSSGESLLSSRDVRRANCNAVLSHLWAGQVLTGSDLMDGTGLTRATVHDVCQELLDAGWIRELPNQRAHGGYVKGRPARRYAFSADAGVVIGVDAGSRRVVAAVADLRGAVLARHSATLMHHGRMVSQRERLERVQRAILSALQEAQIRPGKVLGVVVGVPAPVGEDGGVVITTNPYWNQVNPGFPTYLSASTGWTVLVDNDANLAALAERWIGAGRDERHFVTLLDTEGLGAGVVERGDIMRGSSGRSGELAWLDAVEGLGTAAGISSLLRRWSEDRGRPELRAGAAKLKSRTTPVTFQNTLTAAQHGDPAAYALIERLTHHLARLADILAKVYDTELIILTGQLSTCIEPILDAVRQELPGLPDAYAPRLVASTLGESVVSTGGIRRALDHVQSHALDIVLAVPADTS